MEEEKWGELETTCVLKTEMHMVTKGCFCLPWNDAVFSKKGRGDRFIVPQ